MNHIYMINVSITQNSSTLLVLAWQNEAYSEIILVAVGLFVTLDANMAERPLKKKKNCVHIFL